MNMNPVEIIKKMPGMRSLMHKFELQDDQFRTLEYENLVLAQELIDRRLLEKKRRGGKVNVLFVCHRPPVWGSLKSVYEALKADDLFQVRIVAIPNKKQEPGLGLAHEHYESEGAEAFWQGEDCIRGYDYETGRWLDLRMLKPDYVFFQQPYNLTKPPLYQSGVVSKFAKLAYVAYFSPIVLDDTYEESTPLDFLKDLSFFFTQHEDDHAFISKRYRALDLQLCKLVNAGNPRFDSMEQYASQACEIWNRPDSFKILWTPRWTTNEGNCHFFDYRDQLLGYCEARQDVELVFRPHPQAFKEWNATGEMRLEEQERFRERFKGGNLHLDESPNYYSLLFSTDCLITDRSTLIIDYLVTRKPVIYCTSNGHHDALLNGVDQAVYRAGNWEELNALLEALRRGEDPMKERRERIVRDYLKVGERKAGERIREVLRADALKEPSDEAEIMEGWI